MISRYGPCDTNRLRDFLDAPSNEDGGSCELAEHLEHCEKCRSELEAMAGGRWWNEVRPLVRPPSEEEPDQQTRPNAAMLFDDPELSFLSPPSQEGQLGQFGPYQILGVLGKGGMGVVLKGWEPALRRTVAIKVLSPMLATSGSSRQRFTREAQAAAAVVHNHVVAIHTIDTDKASGLPYLVMPCIIGRSLQERIDRNGPLDIPVLLRIGMQASAGLAAAHAQGIVHRDVKPANILLENGVERVVLTDFGLARAVDDASLTQSGVIAGTPQYMSPEQARGELSDHRSDLFSLGSVLYAMGTGHSPFRAPSALAVLRRVSDEQPRPIRELNPGVPEALAAVIEKLHAKDPAERFQSAAEVAGVLEQLLAELQKPVKRSAAPRESKPVALPRRRQWQPALVAGLIVVVFGSLFAVMTGRNQFPEHPASFSFAPEDAKPGPVGQDVAMPDGGDLTRHRHRSRVASFSFNPKEELAGVVASLSRTECDGDDDDSPVPPIPPIPPIVIDIPLGPLVRLDKENGVSVHVEFGTPGEVIVGSGKPVTKTYNLKDFTAVEIHGPFQLDLKQGKEYKVAITADDNLFDHLKAEKEGKKLVIGFKGNNVSLHLTRENPLKAEVTLPLLEELQLNGAARATADGFSSSHPFRLQINGASRFQGSVKAADVTVDANGASTVKLAGSGKNLRLKTNGASRLKMTDFAASGDRLIVDASGASGVTLKGSVTAGVLKATGASHLDLRDFTLAAADVTLEGASHATVRVTEKLNYSIGSASHLEYSGDPTIGKTEKHGASHVNQKK